MKTNQVIMNPWKLNQLKSNRIQINQGNQSILICCNSKKYIEISTFVTIIKLYKRLKKKNGSRNPDKTDKSNYITIWLSNLSVSHLMGASCRNENCFTKVLLKSPRLNICLRNIKVKGKTSYRKPVEICSYINNSIYYLLKFKDHNDYWKRS